MKIYRVESSFSILDCEDAITIRRNLCVQITPYRSIIDSWSEEWLLHVGYDRPNFMHHSDNNNKRIPLPHEDKLLVKKVLSSSEISRITLMNRDYLYGKRNHFRAEYEKRIFICLTKLM